MQITIDTNNLSEMDINMLAFLADQGEEVVEEEAPKPTKAKAKPAPTPEPEEEEEEEAPKPTKAKAKPAPEPEADDDAEAPTMSDAVAAATALVSTGEAAKVKAALAEIGVKRVSEMDEDSIPAFLAALEA